MRIQTKRMLHGVDQALFVPSCYQLWYGQVRSWYLRHVGAPS